MNHQSLLDIPTAGLMCSPLVPLFVTRKRYHYGVPAVSPCLRLMGCPVIERRERKASLRTMREAARALEHGMLVFAEGHRSRDGEVLPFQTAGVLTVLRERHMPVCLVVTDGFWSAPRLIDSVLGLGSIRGETEVVGVFEPPADDAALPAFVDQLRERMIAHLALMRRRRKDRVEHPRDPGCTLEPPGRFAILEDRSQDHSRLASSRRNRYGVPWQSREENAHEG